MLPYTLARLLTQTAVLERDEATADKWGAETKAERKEYARVKCKFAPYVEQSRGRGQEKATSARTVSEVPALLIVARGTEVTEQKHWVGEVLDAKGAVLMTGPFRVIAVATFETHMELQLERP